MTRTPRPGPFVGVDVVDRTSARAGRHAEDARFIRRVFSDHEQGRIREAPDPEVEVWRLWAAKEAAYKVVSKLEESPPVFQHARFQVVDPPGSPVRELSWEDVHVSIGLAETPEQVLAWAWVGPVSPLLVGHGTVESVRARWDLSEEADTWIPHYFSREEADAIHGLHSALVRLAARRDAAGMLGVAEDRLTIVCRPGHTGLRPPFLRDGGALRSDTDISLSHDGVRLAWAVRLAS